MYAGEKELHTAESTFFHRSWGRWSRLTTLDAGIVKKGGVYTHLVSDHQHYWEDGGCTYHNRYSSWEISRDRRRSLESRFNVPV